jgi:hypothetical protein
MRLALADLARLSAGRAPGHTTSWWASTQLPKRAARTDLAAQLAHAPRSGPGGASAGDHAYQPRFLGAAHHDHLLDALAFELREDHRKRRLTDFVLGCAGGAHDSATNLTVHLNGKLYFVLGCSLRIVLGPQMAKMAQILA